MARNYAALPHDYLEEMELLSDAEFGRLCRALLVYSKTGTTPTLDGNERMLIKRVTMQEDRFQESYLDVSETRREAGRKGASKRWAERDSKAILPDSKNSRAIPANGKNGNTETNTNTNTETDTPLSNDSRSKARAAVVSAYLDRINPSASQSSIGELTAFADEMGQEVCLRAMDIALDNKKATWSYIRGILRNWQALGVKCLADIERLDKKPDGAKPEAGGKKLYATDYRTPEAQNRLAKDMAELEALMRGEANG